MTNRAGLVRGAVLAYLVAALSPNIYVANAALPVPTTTLCCCIRTCFHAHPAQVAQRAARGAGVRGLAPLLHRPAHAAG